MTREQFDQLVAELHTASRNNPRAYNIRAGALAILGYGYIFGVLLLSILLTLGIGLVVLKFPNGATIKLGLVFGAVSAGMAWAISKALWVRLDAPQGIELTRTDCPDVFALLDKLRERFKGPRFHHVLLVGDYNAAVTQVPRLGVFGWQRNYLLLGLPLMQSLSPAEFEAVLAHEFGHLSGNHARFGAWIYRIRRTWERVFEEMAKQRQSAAIVLTKFVDWFWPKFNAHAFVLARANEYEADRCAAEFSGAQTAGRALMRVTLHGTLLDETFWPSVFKQVNATENPPGDVYDQTATALKGGVPSEDSSRWLKTAFLLETNNGDTHPCLKDRLTALGVLPEGVSRGEFPKSLPDVDSSAAQHFLGDKLQPLATRLSESWRDALQPLWQERRKQVLELEKELSDTSSDAGTPPSAEQLWKKARALIDKDGDEAALPVLHQLLTLQPDHAAANFVQGRFLLSKDDPCGIPLIERAVAKDEMLTQSACELLYGHYTRTGQRDKLRELENKVDAFQERSAEAVRERNNITAADTFLPSELKAREMEALQKILAAEPDIQSVSVARKQVRVFPDHPILVFAVSVKVPFWKPRSSSADLKLVNRLADSFKLEEQFLIFVADSNLKSLAKKIGQVPNASIYIKNPSK